MQAERITDVICYHMEGPCWWPDWGGLRFVDMLAGEVVQLDRDGRLTRRRFGRIAACVRPRVFAEAAHDAAEQAAAPATDRTAETTAGMIVVTERGFTLLDEDDTVTDLPDVSEDPALRMNEGGCAPDGSLYAGQMAYDKTPGAAAMYRLDVHRRAERVFGDLTISNGLDWTADGTRAYYIDTDTGRIDVFDWSARDGLVDRRPFVTIPDGGRPDGLTVDAEGGVWAAIAGGGRVEHYTPDGRLADVVEVAAKKVTACTFGGADLAELYITTSRENVPEGEDPHAGSLFRVVPGGRGKLPYPYGG